MSIKIKIPKNSTKIGANTPGELIGWSNDLEIGPRGLQGNQIFTLFKKLMVSIAFHEIPGMHKCLPDIYLIIWLTNTVRFSTISPNMIDG